MGDGFLGTGASMKSDLVLLTYLFFLLPGMLLGFYFARRKKFSPHHKLTMTTVVILNWVLISILMIGSYRTGVLPYLNAQSAGDVRVVLPVLHAITGGIGQLLATYLMIRMWFEKVLPSWLMVKRIKRYMRFTLALWIITIVLGVVIYVVWYFDPTGNSQNTVQPAVTAEPGATIEPGATLEFMQPAATEDPHAGHYNAPAATVEPGATAEVNDESDPDNATRDAIRATEDAADDSADATEDAADDSADATEDAAKDAAKATEDASKDD